MYESQYRYIQSEKGKITQGKYKRSKKGKAMRERERKKRLKKLYGVSVEQYDQMFEQQNGVCAICGEPEINKPLSVDHDHKTGKVRGLLCWKCNMCLGIFEKRFDDFTEYLKTWKG